MVYLDHAATTPMLPEALEAYLTVAGQPLGNPSSLHASGRTARRLVEEAREQVAAALGARPSEVIFTSGGTESDNLAIKGLYWSRRRPEARRVLTTRIEHHALLDAVVWLGTDQGATVEWIGVDQQGLVAPHDLRDLQEPQSINLISIGWVNNEIGTVQPIPQLAAQAANKGIPFHTDAVQAIGVVPVDFAASGVTAMSVSGHKFGGPQGVGVLLAARDAELTPLAHGGGQERDIRSGTPAVASIVAFATAVELAVKHQADNAIRLARLRDRLIAEVQAKIPDVALTGPPPGETRAAGNAHLRFQGCEADALLMLLDANGIECSTGSACLAGLAEPSHVVRALGYDDQAARSGLRFSLGHTSTDADVDALVAALPAAVQRARKASQT